MSITSWAAMGLGDGKVRVSYSTTYLLNALGDENMVRSHPAFRRPVPQEPVQYLQPGGLF